MLGQRSKRRSRARLGAWSVLGAWLRIWTPPKGVEVPPVPVRSLALGGLAVGLVLAGGVLLASQRIGASRQAAEAEERRASDARRASERRRLALEQRPRSGRGPSTASPRSRAEERRARRSLLRRLERAIDADARARLEAGTLAGRRIVETRCSPYPATSERAREEAAQSTRRASYSCIALTVRVPGVVGLGHPFLAVVDYDDSSYVWCKVNPVAGERAVPDPKSLVPLPEACTG